MSIVRPYGDTTGDGMVQLSFTLPVPHDKRAEGAAVQAVCEAIETSAAQARWVDVSEVTGPAAG